jgi:hypothetical protein
MIVYMIMRIVLSLQAQDGSVNDVLLGLKKAGMSDTLMIHFLQNDTLLFHNFLLCKICKKVKNLFFTNFLQQLLIISITYAHFLPRKKIKIGLSLEVIFSK